MATADSVDSSPAIANGVLFIGSDDRKLYAVNAAAGASLWQGFTSNVVHSSPAVWDGMVFVGSSDNRLYAFALDGSSNAAYRQSICRRPMRLYIRIFA